MPLIDPMEFERRRMGIPQSPGIVLQSDAPVVPVTTAPPVVPAATPTPVYNIPVPVAAPQVYNPTPTRTTRRTTNQRSQSSRRQAPQQATSTPRPAPSTAAPAVQQNVVSNTTGQSPTNTITNWRPDPQYDPRYVNYNSAPLPAVPQWYSPEMEWLYTPAAQTLAEAADPQATWHRDDTYSGLPQSSGAWNWVTNQLNSLYDSYLRSRLEQAGQYFDDEGATMSRLTDPWANTITNWQPDPQYDPRYINYNYTPLPAVPQWYSPEMSGMYEYYGTPGDYVPSNIG